MSDSFLYIKKNQLYHPFFHACFWSSMNLTKNKNFIPFHVDTDVLWFQLTQYPAVGRLLSKIPVPTHHGEKYPYLLNTWKKILDPSLKIILFCSYPTRCKLWHSYPCQVRTKIALTNNSQPSWHFFFCDSQFWCWWLVQRGE